MSERKRRTLDPELAAMHAAVLALEACPEPARARVVAYIVERFGVDMARTLEIHGPVSEALTRVVEGGGS